MLKNTKKVMFIVVISEVLSRPHDRFVFKDDRSLPGCLQQQLGFFRVSPFYVETL